MRARDRAHLTALQKWASEAAVMAESDKQPGADDKARRHAATQFCLVKVRWASLGLTSQGRRCLPGPVRASIAEVRRAIRDYRTVDEEQVAALARSAPTRIARPLENLLAEDTPE